LTLLSVVHQADLREEVAHQLEEEEDPGMAPVVAVAEAANADADPGEAHTAQTEAAADDVVDAADDHPSTVALRRDSTGRVQVETSRGYKQMVPAAAAGAVLEVEVGRTEQVQMGPGPEQERAKVVVHTG
jgi:hypothetical protein